MRRKANRSILTMGITIVVILLFIWHFNRRFELLKERPKPDVQTTAPSAERIEDSTRGDKNAILLDARDAKLPILACFCAGWHYSCQEMSKLLARMKSRFGDRLQVRVIDPSEEAALARQFRIDSLPTFVLFDANGKLVLRSEGTMTERELLDALARAGLGD